MECPIEMIYIDLDGLGAAWELYMLQKYFPGITIEELNAREDRDKRLRAIYRNEPELFYNLPVIPEFRDVLAAVIATGIPWSILTADGGIHHSREQVRNDKTRYVKEHFGVEKENIIVTVTSAEKKQYARPGTLLIDDYVRNTTEWDAAGGRSVLVDTDSYDANEVIRKIHLVCGI